MRASYFFMYYQNFLLKLKNYIVTAFLTFGYDFNQPLQIPASVTHLTFGNDFNQPLTEGGIIKNKLIQLIINEKNKLNILDAYSIIYIDHFTYFYTLLNKLADYDEHEEMQSNFSNNGDIIKKLKGKIIIEELVKKVGNS